MKRRDFFVAAGATAAMPAFGFARNFNSDDKEPGDFIEMIRYRLAVGSKRNAVRDFYRDAAIPVLNKMGISPIGVFNVKYGPNDPNLYVLIPHKSIESFITLTDRILANDDLVKAGNEFLNTPMSDPSYVRMEKTLLKAFKYFSTVEVPASMMNNGSRIYELRTYESHSIKMAKKKVEMFNEGGEIPIFRKTGFTPVFYGETLAGNMMPCLTYMLAFNDMDERDKCWKAFGSDPDWQKLSKDPQYKDTVSNITDIFLTPDPCSQV